MHGHSPRKTKQQPRTSVVGMLGQIRDMHRLTLSLREQERYQRVRRRLQQLLTTVSQQVPPITIATEKQNVLRDHSQRYGHTHGTEDRSAV